MERKALTDVDPQLKRRIADDFWRGRTWRGKILGWDDMTADEQARSLADFARFKAKEYDPDLHPHAPAGGPDGGQFVPAGEGGGGGGDAKPDAGEAKPESGQHSEIPSHADKGPNGAVHAGGYITEAHFQQGEAGKTVFENINYKINREINSNPQNMSRGMQKDQISKQLSTRLQEDPRWTKAFGTDPAKSYNAASMILSQWANTSGDADSYSIAMQLATRDEFDLSGATTKHMLEDFGFDKKEGTVWQKAAERVSNNMLLGTRTVKVSDLKGALRAFARAEYNHTQAWFKERGITEVAVFRGMGRALGRQNHVVGATTLQPMSSFSTNRGIAGMFVRSSLPRYKQNILASVIPVKSVLSTSRSGRGAWHESEIVVLGNKMGFIGSQKSSPFPPPVSKIKWPKGKAGWVRVVKAEGDEDVDLNDLRIDEDLDHADWVKQHWDLPPYKSPEFMALPFADDLPHFRTLPVYKHAVENGLIVNDEWVGPTEPSAPPIDVAGKKRNGAVFLKEFDEDEHPRDSDGQWTDGGGGGSKPSEKPADKPGDKKPKEPSAKVRNALATYKPSTKEKQARAAAAEALIVKMVGGKGTDDNAPMDVLVNLGRKTIGVEVKSIQDNGNNKITMHPDSLQRKRDWQASGRGRSVHTVVVDARYNKIYYRKGAGSFRLHTLTPVKNARQLRQLLGIAA